MAQESCAIILPQFIAVCVIALNLASFKLLTVKIRRGVLPVGELTESVTDTQTHAHTQVNLYSVHT